MKRRSLSGHPVPSGCRYGWLLAIPNASINVILPIPASVPVRARRRAGPLGDVERLDRLVLQLGAEVVGDDDLHVDVLAAQFGNQPGGGGGEPADPSQRCELGRREHHLHGWQRRWHEPQRKPIPSECLRPARLTECERPTRVRRTLGCVASRVYVEGVDHTAKGRACRDRLQRRARHVGRCRLDAAARCAAVRYTADLGQADEPDLSRRARARQAVRRRSSARLDRLPHRAGSRRSVALQCGAFHISHRGQDVLQHHSARPRRHRHACSCGQCTSDGVDIWGDGSTYKGNDIERFYRYGLLVNPEPADLQAVARRRLRHRARRPHGDERVPDRRTTCRTATARRRRTAPTPTSGARRTRPSRWRSSARRWTSSSRSWASPTTATTSRSPPRSSRFGSTRAGRSRSTATSSRRRSSWCRRPTRSVVGTGWA